MKPENKTGIFEGVSWEDYQRIDRTNWSSLKHMKRSPFHFRAAKLVQQEDTDAMRLGRAIHLAILEPERYRASVAIWDGGRRAGKDWEKFCEANVGREILTETQGEQVQAVTRAVLSNEFAAKYVCNGSAEVTMQWTYTVPALGGLPGFSVECKGRKDFAPGAVGAVVDIKSCQDASPEGFARQCWNLDYFDQGAFYVDGHAAATGEVLPYVIVAVETKAPNAVQVYRLPEHALEVGRQSYRALLSRLALCRQENRWPAYSDGELDLELPRWAQAANDDEDATGMDLVVGE